MKITDTSTHLTPPEANLIENACAYTDDPEIISIRLKTQRAKLNWTLSVLPESTISIYQGARSAYSLLTASAEGRWQIYDGETVATHFDKHELELIRGLTQVAIIKTQSKASGIDSLYDEVAKLEEEDAESKAAGLFDSSLDPKIAEEGLGMIRGHVFETDLARIAAGHAIVVAIDEHLAQ